MEWIIEPFKGFKKIGLVLNDNFETRWDVCTLKGGLLVCTGKGASWSNYYPHN